ncbi:LuxR C-terminal-related transcriptional regulator [Streptomyces filamentosus]|uniref:DNA-binding response regulator n=1 Tax=Streptomyces filamentosus TaxID=67294 RepID=A0A919EQ06_STRFL|nr:response regulator transcription factor [Streptomyces filamentosus]GHG08366.1 DNA-binding response regulator [Streptomyces filamentosus]
MTIRVLVVDDQYLIRAGIVGLLRAADGMTVVGEAADGTEAVTEAARSRPDVVLADTADPPPRILMLTTFDLDEYVYRALRAGASGFVLKDTGPQRLLAAVTAVAGGDTLFAPSVTRRLVEAFTRAPAPDGPAARRPEIDQLTARETEVLRLTGTGRSNAEIAERLFISEATVKTHLNRTMAKLDLNSRAQAVVLAYESGLVAPGRPLTPDTPD